MSARIRLRRTDGKLFLDRRGFECRWFGVFLHKIEAPDPGEDLHDHPWPFWSLVLKGGYEEIRCHTDVACLRAQHATRHPDLIKTRGWRNIRYPWSWKKLGLDECHGITKVFGGPCWTLLFRGPKRKDRQWGFFTPEGFVLKDEYDSTRDRPLFEEMP